MAAISFHLIFFQAGFSRASRISLQATMELSPGTEERPEGGIEKPG